MRDSGGQSIGLPATYQIVTQNESIQAELGRRGLLNLRAVIKTKR